MSSANDKADAVIRCDKALFDDIVTGQANAMAALLRGAIGVEGDLGARAVVPAALPRPAEGRTRGRPMSDGLVKILDGNTFVVSDRRGDIEASLDRPDRALLVRHALPVEVGADRRTASG